MAAKNQKNSMLYESKMLVKPREDALPFYSHQETKSHHQWICWFEKQQDVVLVMALQRANQDSLFLSGFSAVYVEKCNPLFWILNCYADTQSMRFTKPHRAGQVHDDLVKENRTYRCFYETGKRGFAMKDLDWHPESGPETREIIDKSFLVLLIHPDGAPVAYDYWPWWVRTRFKLFINSLQRRAKHP